MIWILCEKPLFCASYSLDDVDSLDSSVLKAWKSLDSLDSLWKTIVLCIVFSKWSGFSVKKHAFRSAKMPLAVRTDIVVTVTILFTNFSSMLVDYLSTPLCVVLVVHLIRWDLMANSVCGGMRTLGVVLNQAGKTNKIVEETCSGAGLKSKVAL